MRFPSSGQMLFPLMELNAVQQAAQQQQNQQNQQVQNLQNTIDAASISSGQSDNGVTQQANSGNQTVGGTPGNFGDEGENKQEAGKKPLPMCT